MADAQLVNDINTRRTFAIISHPDAGKTTITEKLILLGQLIQVAGTVKGKKNDKSATSDWMSDTTNMLKTEVFLLHIQSCGKGGLS